MRAMARLLLACFAVAMPGYAMADEARLSFGGDQYAAGQAVIVSTAVERDAFAAGYDVSLQAPVTGDAHLAGYNVSNSAAVSGDVYAAGFSVSQTGTVGGDVTAIGNTVLLHSTSPVAGNARLAGATVTIASPLQGSAIITAKTLTLDAVISGDLNFFGETIVFGPAAKVAGSVTIQAPKEIAVPETVASADRVKFQRLVEPDYASQAGKTAEHVVRGIWPAIWATGLWWLLLFVVGTVFITLLPRLVASLTVATEVRQFRNLGLGLLGFAAVVGLVPVFALTLVGIFLLPFVLIFVVTICILAYLAGTYLVGARVAKALMPIDTNIKRLVVLAISIVIAGLLAMIPVVGWLLSLVLLVYGFGAIVLITMVRWSSKDAPRLTETSSAAGPTSA